MSTKIWRPSVAEPVAQVTGVEITAVDGTPSNNTFGISIAGVLVSVAGDTDVATTAGNLVTAWNASKHPLHAGITASLSTATVVLTGDVAGVPFTVSKYLAGAGSGTIADPSTTTEATSRHHASNVNNWYDATAGTYGELPTTDDTVVIDGPYSILWDLDQTAEDPALVIVLSSFSGRIGLDPSRLATSEDGVPRRQVSSFAVTYDASGVYTVTRQGMALAVLADTDAATTAAAIAAEWNSTAHPAFLTQTAFLSEATPDAIAAARDAGKRPQCRGITAYADNGTVRFTADDADLAFEISASASGGSAAVSAVATVHRDDCGEYRETRLGWDAAQWMINVGPGGAQSDRIRIYMHTTSDAECEVHQAAASWREGMPSVDVRGGDTTQKVHVVRCAGGVGNCWGTGEASLLGSIRIGDRASAGDTVWISEGKNPTKAVMSSGRLVTFSQVQTLNVSGTGRLETWGTHAGKSRLLEVEENGRADVCHAYDGSDDLTETIVRDRGVVSSRGGTRTRTWPNVEVRGHEARLVENMQRAADLTAPQLDGLETDDLTVTNLIAPKNPPALTGARR